jgi:peptide/nickel transport system ATP-binding protein
MSALPDVREVRQAAALSVERLTVEVGTEAASRYLVRDISFAVEAGKTLCIAGESGSGKSITSLAIMGLLPRAARVAAGSIRFRGSDLTNLQQAQMEAIRGKQIAMIFQEPMTSLNPLMTIGQQLAETLRRHEHVDKRGARAASLAMLDAVHMTEAARRLDQYSHELSGGMRQRVMIAMAMLCKPSVLIADEPTTALDVTVQAQILELMRELQREFGTAMVMITHDMGVVAEMADEIAIMQKGELREVAPARKLFREPRHDYTKALLAAVPMPGTQPPPESRIDEPVVLRVEHLAVRFPMRKERWGAQHYLHAVEDVSFELRRGETLGLVGESGCGKSTTGKAMINMVPYEGSVKLFGRELNGCSRDALQEARRDVQMIFQDPYASLNPRKTVLDLVGEPLLIHQRMPSAQRTERVAGLLEQVGLSADMMKRYPHQFSGGQRQRICIARALSLNPKIIVADESVAALDVSIRAQVLEIFEQLQRDHQISYVFVSHDMSVIERVCHRVAVMFGGRIVEIGRRDRVLKHPQHPYTRRLLEAVPIPDVDFKRDFRSLLKDIERRNPIYPDGYTPARPVFDAAAEDHYVTVQ